ncbi:MAG: hypothetical protein LBL99_03955 [Holosporaceae bacterium]|jgi:hypothetical protein|nr:hypothetical protein [Holosporaceae bacterium]
MYDNNMGLDGQAQTTFKDLCELLGTRPTSKSAKPLFRKLETLLMAGADHQLESTHPDAADNGAETPTPWTTNTLVQTEPENQNAVVRLTGGPQPIGLPTLPHETARTQLTRLIGKLWPLEETLWKSTHCRHSASLIKLLPTLQTKSGVLARAIYSENYEDELDARWLRSAYEDLITYIQGLISMKIEIEEYLVYRTGVNLTRLGHLHSVCDHLKGLVHLHSKALPRNILKLIETTAEHDGKLVDHWSLILDTSCDSIAAMDMAVRLPRLSPTAQRLVQCPCMPDLSPDMRLALQGSHLPALLMEARPLQSPRRKR